jgi:D-3-phosphoglycerate dehydrogenase
LFDPELKAELEKAAEEVIYNPHQRPLTVEELVQLIPPVHGVIAGLDTYSRPVFEAAKNLQVVSRYGVGVDQIDLDAAREFGVTITNTPGANANSVAELSLGLMLSLLRSIPEANQKTKSGEWPRMRGAELSGKTIGLIGLGAIGQQLAGLLKGFECEVLACDPFISHEVAQKYLVKLLPIKEILPQAEIISLHLPVTPDTKNMVDSQFFEQMKQGSYLINTARGELVVEEDLLKAIEAGQLAGAGLDVFCQEPPSPGNPLLGDSRIITTPHISSHTQGSANRMGQIAVKQCLAALSGEQPLNIVD